jgi:hypothetical protein
MAGGVYRLAILKASGLCYNDGMQEGTCIIFASEIVVLCKTD